MASYRGENVGDGGTGVSPDWKMIFAQRSIEEYTANVTDITNEYGLFREETFVLVYENCLNAKAVVVMALAASQLDSFQLCIRSYVHAHKQPSFVLDTPFASSHPVIETRRGRKIV